MQVIVAAFEHLEASGPAVPTGLGAFSFAVGPTLIAALQPEIRERADFVLAVGGYYDLHQLISFYTETSRSNARWVLGLGLANRLASPKDRAVLSAIARQRLLGRDDAEEDVASTASLSRHGKTVYALLTSTEPARIPQLIADLPETLRAELTALNPAAQDLSELNARLIVLHGRADPIIPYTESLAMAEAIADEQVRLFVIDGLAHVELKPERRDLPALLSAIDALLAERGVASK